MLHHEGAPRVHPGQVLERGIEGEDPVGTEGSGEGVIVERHRAVTAAPFLRHAPARGVDQDLAHGTRGNRPEVGVALEGNRPSGSQLEPGLVGERGGVEGLAGPSPAHLVREPEQLGIDALEELVHRGSVAAGGGPEQRVQRRHPEVPTYPTQIPADVPHCGMRENRSRPPYCLVCPAMLSPAALVSTVWLAEHLGDPAVVPVEVSVDTCLYGQGHIPGAVGWNWKTQLSDPVRRDLLSREAYRRLMSVHGIGRDDTVVLYGDCHNWFAAWAFWQLVVQGHRDVRLLNGGRNKWEMEERPLTSALPGA